MEDESKWVQDTLAALDEIDCVLHQMLVLAKLSADGGNINRINLQAVMEHLQQKINRIADRMDTI